MQPGTRERLLLTRAARSLFEGIIFGLIIGICAIGLSLIYGTTGLVNFAHGELVDVRRAGRLVLQLDGLAGST